MLNISENRLVEKHEHEDQLYEIGMIVSRIKSIIFIMLLFVLILFSFFSSILDSSSKFWELKEKKETSEPDIKAENNIKIPIHNTPRINIILCRSAEKINNKE